MDAQLHSTDETTVIVDAVRKIQEDPELAAEARSNLPGALDRLGLTGIARQAVASAVTLGLAGLAVGKGGVSTQAWWLT